MPESNKGSDDKGLAYYACFAVIFGTIGACVGCTIAQDLGEVILADGPPPGYAHFMTESESTHIDGYTQAGKAWVGGSTGVGALFGMMLVMLYRNSAVVKSTFTSLFNSKRADTSAGAGREPLLNNNI
jgi:hypothetical protein